MSIESLNSQGKASAWERAVHSFGQRRQLPALAPHVPLESPRLRATAYEMVLAALLLAPVHHSTLLETVHRWPPHLYDLQAFTDATLKRGVVLGLIVVLTLVKCRNWRVKW